MRGSVGNTFEGGSPRGVLAEESLPNPCPGHLIPGFVRRSELGFYGNITMAPQGRSRVRVPSLLKHPYPGLPSPTGVGDPLA